MYHSDSRFYLRSLPFVGAILGFLLTLYLFPNVVSTIIDYILHSDPEQYFSPEGWSLYALIIPLCIAGFSRLEDNWGLILILLLFPPVLALSYWLWELLAWAMFGILFIWLLMAFDNEDAYIGLIIAEGVYAICRVFGSFGDGNLDTIGDALFITILGGYMLYISLVDTLYYKEKFKPSGISMLYILIMCITLLCLSGLNKSATTTTKKVVQTTTVQKTIYYCTATSGVNVRYTPSTNSKVVGKLKHGEAVEVLEKGGTFTKIAYNHSKGTSAWVSTEYLSPTKPATTTTTDKAKKTKSNNSATTTSAKTSKTTTSSSSTQTTTKASSSKSSTSTTSTILFVDSKTSLNYTLSSSSGQRIFTVATGASDYQIASKPSWCTILRKSKGQFEIKYDANPKNVERSGTIQIKSGDAMVPIVLVQSAGTGYSSSNTTSTYSSSSTAKSSSSSTYSSSSTAKSSSTSTGAYSNKVGVHNNHEYVDLGLSVKWATCNIGASKPENPGNYFAWGEIKKKNDYSQANWSGRRSNQDAAKVIWKGKWRMPTASEAEELKTKCTWKYKTQNGMKGYLVTSNINGASIFLPAAGHYVGNSVYHYNEDGDYLTTSERYSKPVRMSLSPSYVGVWDTDYGYFGCSIRPVCP